MKKYFTFGLIMSLVSGACFAEHPMIAQLIREKQQKMEKLEKCKGTTKNLKIAGISTLGITAVGVGANIAEAVVLDKAKTATKKAEKDFKTEEKKKTDREAAEKARQDKCDAWNGSLSGNTCEISGLIKGSNSDVDSAINSYTSSTCSNVKRTDLVNDRKSKIEATCEGINVVAYVNMPVEKAEPKAETPAPANAKSATEKDADKPAVKPADKKGVKQPAKSVANKKVGELAKAAQKEKEKAEAALEEAKKEGDTAKIAVAEEQKKKAEEDVKAAEKEIEKNKSFAELCSSLPFQGTSIDEDNETLCNSDYSTMVTSLDELKGFVNVTLRGQTNYLEGFGYSCKQMHSDTYGYNDYYYVCTKDDYTIVTNGVKIEKPCASWGNGAVFDANNISCGCDDNHIAKDGKCESKKNEDKNGEETEGQQEFENHCTSLGGTMNDYKDVCTVIQKSPKTVEEWDGVTIDASVVTNLDSNYDCDFEYNDTEDELYAKVCSKDGNLHKIRVANSYANVDCGVEGVHKCAIDMDYRNFKKECDNIKGEMGADGELECYVTKPSLKTPDDYDDFTDKDKGVVWLIDRGKKNVQVRSFLSAGYLYETASYADIKCDNGKVFDIDSIDSVYIWRCLLDETSAKEIDKSYNDFKTLCDSYKGTIEDDECYVEFSNIESVDEYNKIRNNLPDGYNCGDYHMYSDGTARVSCSNFYTIRFDFDLNKACSEGVPRVVGDGSLTCENIEKPLVSFCDKIDGKMEDGICISSSWLSRISSIEDNNEYVADIYNAGLELDEAILSDDLRKVEYTYKKDGKIVAKHTRSISLKCEANQTIEIDKTTGFVKYKDCDEQDYVPDGRCKPCRPLECGLYQSVSNHSCIWDDTTDGSSKQNAITMYDTYEFDNLAQGRQFIKDNWVSYVSNAKCSYAAVDGDYLMYTCELAGKTRNFVFKFKDLSDGLFDFSKTQGQIP